MQPSQPSLSALGVAAAVAGGTVALIVLGLQPMLYGAYAAEGTISAQRLGLLAAVELAGIAIGSAVAVQTLAWWRTQSLVLFAIALLMAGNFVPIPAGASALLFVTRSIAGLGGGVLVGIAGVAIARTNKMGAWAGAFVCSQALVPYLVMRGFMHFNPVPTSHEVQFVLAAAALFVLPMLPFFPARMFGGAEQSLAGLPKGRGLIGLAAVLLCVGATGGIWSYLEVWMETRGIARVDSTALITTSLLGQIIGAVIGAAMADGRWAWLRLILIIAGLVASVVGWMILPTSHIMAFAFGSVYALGAPAFAPTLARLDALGRAVPYNATAQLAGLAILPTIAGQLFASASLDAVILGLLAAMLASLVLVLSQIPFLLSSSRLRV